MPHEEKYGERVGGLTLLSQLPTARKSATGQKAREDIASGGGSVTSTSFSAVDETFADVVLAPKKAMIAVLVQPCHGVTRYLHKQLILSVAPKYSTVAPLKIKSTNEVTREQCHHS